MNLKPVNPPLRDGQSVLCAKCQRWTRSAVADLDDRPGTFYCETCRPDNPVCPNCGQWQHASTGDCLNDCAKRGFAPFAKAVES